MCFLLQSRSPHLDSMYVSTRLAVLYQHMTSKILAAAKQGLRCQHARPMDHNHLLYPPQRAESEGAPH